jgi:methylmalonyl-CoA mutase cobalamin-binding subunit
VEPLLFGHSIGVSPVALLTAAAFWTWLWGPVGLLLSTPLTACLVVLGRYVPSLEFLGTLLGVDPPLDPPVRFYQRLLARDQDEAVDQVEEHLRVLPPETVYDQVLLPALVLARRDRDRGALPADDEQYVYRVTEDVLEDLDPPQFGKVAEPVVPAGRRDLLVLGCPAHDRADELALEMFRKLLEPAGVGVEVLSSRATAAEVVKRVEEAAPAVVCVAALPPGGVALGTHLCKRLRACFPGLRIVVGRWGQEEQVEKVRERFRHAGADVVSTTLLDTLAQVKPLLRVASHAAGPAGTRPAAAPSR